MVIAKTVLGRTKGSVKKLTKRTVGQKPMTALLIVKIVLTRDHFLIFGWGDDSIQLYYILYIDRG